MISTVINRPIPPCCIDWLVKPSAPSPVMLLMMLDVQSAAATLSVSCSTRELMKASMPIENRVPIPYSSHFWNKPLVCSNIRHMINNGAKPMTNARVIS